MLQCIILYATFTRPSCRLSQPLGDCYRPPYLPVYLAIDSRDVADSRVVTYYYYYSCKALRRLCHLLSLPFFVIMLNEYHLKASVLG